MHWILLALFISPEYLSVCLLVCLSAFGCLAPKVTFNVNVGSFVLLTFVRRQTTTTTTSQTTSRTHSDATSQHPIPGDTDDGNNLR